MAHRKIIWSYRAKIKRYEILEFYIKRNGSNTYSIKLNKKINSNLKLLETQPSLGIKTDIEGVRGLIIKDLTIYYEIFDEKIIVHTIWDCKQNPNDLIIM